MMEESTLELIKKQRTATRGWLSRSVQELRQLLEDESTTSEDLEAAAEDFDVRLSRLDELQTQYENELPEDEDLENEISLADDFRRDAKRLRIAAAKKMKSAKIDLSASSENVCASIEKKSDVKLPRLELPKYSGALTEWQSFWERFDVLVNQSDLATICKYSYLQSLVKGEALAVIQGLALTEMNYDVACTMLKDRFGRSEKIMNISLPSKGDSYISSLWKLQDELQRHVRSLECLGISGEKYGVVLTPVILSCLPRDFRLEWSRTSSGHEGDLQYLLQFLQKEIQLRERSENLKEFSIGGVAHQEKKKSARISTTTALQTSSQSDPGCVFCIKNHRSDKCWLILKLDLPNREKKIREAKICFKCLGKGHFSGSCTKKVVCNICSGNHCHLLCRSKPTSTVSVSSNPVENVALILSCRLVFILHHMWGFLMM